MSRILSQEDGSLFRALTRQKAGPMTVKLYQTNCTVISNLFQLQDDRKRQGQGRYLGTMELVLHRRLESILWCLTLSKNILALKGESKSATVLRISGNSSFHPISGFIGKRKKGAAVCAINMPIAAINHIDVIAWWATYMQTLVERFGPGHILWLQKAGSFFAHCVPSWLLCCLLDVDPLCRPMHWSGPKNIWDALASHEVALAFAISNVAWTLMMTHSGFFQEWLATPAAISDENLKIWMLVWAFIIFHLMCHSCVIPTISHSASLVIHVWFQISHCQMRLWWHLWLNPFRAS